jgi:hypothetical protein
MKDQITITQEEFRKAVKDTIEFFAIEAAKKKDINPMASSVAGLLYSAFAVKLTLDLFEDDETLEIENDK